jgi:hypothetical protein
MGAANRRRDGQGMAPCQRSTFISCHLHKNEDITVVAHGAPAMTEPVPIAHAQGVHVEERGRTREPIFKLLGEQLGQD